ncbi:glycoside hydrolase family 73 protein [Aerococcaceae bacterium DSM 111020]|nr:glycoside hydrolase family 73 protein [Aerococcaceae bacterium DSM 111020]
MAKRKKRTKKTKSYKRRKKNRFSSWWKRVMPVFLQRVGCITIFFVLFAILLGLIVYRIADYSIEQYQEEQQEVIQRESFIETLVPTAQRLQRQYGILASVSLGQAALESDFGTSELGAEYHNLYGVKTEASDPQGADMKTSEYVDGEWIEIVDRFKVYPSWEDSMREHAELIYYGTSWDQSFYEDVLVGDTYQEQARGLQSAGYATDPDYADKVIQMIEAWNLDQYDQPIESQTKTPAEAESEQD